LGGGSVAKKDVKEGNEGFLSFSPIAVAGKTSSLILHEAFSLNIATAFDFSAR
jgi:hypothetical protein